MTPALKDFAPGTLVEDVHYKEWGTGVVVARLKTKLFVRFSGTAARCWSDKNGIMKWDVPHVRHFLRKVAI